MLYSQVTPNSELAAVVRSVSPLRSYFPDQLTLLASLRMMRDLTTSEQFVGGVSFRYLTKNKEGTWCVVIIFVGVLPKNIPLRNDKGLSWVKYPSTETGIRMILTNHIRYPSPVLTEDIDPVVWTGLLNHLRHMRSGKVINRKKASKHVYNLQRSSHTSEDVGLTPRPAFRQLLQLRPSSEPLPSEFVQSGIGG